MKKVLTNITDFGDENDSDENDTQKDGANIFKKKTAATIYLIDARKKMFLPSFDDVNVAFIDCLQCIRSAIRNKIFSFEKCYSSIILLGTNKIDNALKLKGLSVVQELNLLGAEHVMKIDEIIKAVENSTFEKTYGFDSFSLGDAFWLSSHTFYKRSQKINKNIVLFTNDDNPSSDDPKDKSRAISSAQDMFRASISLEIIHMGKDFDITKFYKEIIIASKNDKNYVIPDPATNGEEMLKRVSKNNYKHVTFVKLPFVISDNFQIGVSVHYLVRKVKIPFKVKLSRATNELVKTKMQFFETETGSLVQKDDIIKSQVIGLRDIDFTPSELKAISEVGKTELRLLGFKPASTLRLENFVKPCAFIYPDEPTYKGSSLFFTALLKRCIAKQVVAICTFCPRSTSACRFVALIAQEEFLREDKSQELPPGFVVFFLPFAEEVRTIEDKETKRAQPEDVELAAKLIKKLKFNYKVESFENPKLKTHWAAVEALALDLSEPEEVNDSTVPNYDLISQRTGKIAKEFLESVYSEDYDPESFAAPKKSKPFSKPKVEGRLGDIERLVKSGKGELLSNDVLKTYLTSVGQGKGLSKMKKVDLLEKVRTHLNLN